MNKTGLFFLAILGFCTACSNPNPTPKPRAYFEIKLPVPEYITENDCGPFSFEISKYSYLRKDHKSTETLWFDIHYPQLNATIYCNYLPINNENRSEIENANQEFVTLHLKKAAAFQEQTFENPEENVFGILYKINGNVASPTQFLLTDSVHSIFRGVLYFEKMVQQDSIAPVLEYINNDIETLIESFRWKM